MEELLLKYLIIKVVDFGSDCKLLYIISKDSPKYNIATYIKDEDYEKLKEQFG